MSDQETWDVFESESLSVRRAQTPEQIRNALLNKELTEDDLTRPAGTSTPWRRLGDVIGEWQEGTAASAAAASTSALDSGPSSGASMTGMTDDLELVNPEIEIEFDSSGEILPSDGPTPIPNVLKPVSPELVTKSAPALSWLSESDSEESLEDVEIVPPASKAEPVKEIHEVVESEPDENWLEPSVQLMPDESSRNDLSGFIGHSDDEEEEEFTLSRASVEKVDELDLAAMVDVAFQLVLFFMVTASVTLIKTMDLPKPTESTKPAAASAPGVGTKSKNEVETEFIVVAITAGGDITVDDEPATVDQLVERLREARTSTGKTGMLLRAENKTKHRTAVAAYDAANAIGLRIAIERETTE